VWVSRLIGSIKQYNFIEIELHGEVLEEEERSVIPFYPRRKRLTVWDLERIFSHASSNPNIIGILISINELKIGMARAEAIRRRILDLREKGKHIFVYLEGGGNIEYSISSAASEVYLAPWSVLNLIGLKVEAVFLRDTLEMLGIDAQLTGIGEYKSAVETFTKNSMSEPHRIMLDSIIEDLYKQFIENISIGRGLESNNIKNLIDAGPFTAQEAFQRGLIDNLGYKDDLEGNIQEKLDTPIKKIRGESLLKILNFKDFVRNLVGRFKRDRSIIAILSDSGIITHGESKGSGAAKTLGSKTITRTLTRIAKDKNVKAIIIRILSPGGSGISSDLIRHQIKVISERKPVIVSMSDVAASGGYLIALGARKIVAEPSTLTGSIGVIGGKFNLERLYKRIGVIKESVVRGKNALIYSSFKGFTSEEDEYLTKIMRSMYEQFVKLVSEHRGIELETASGLAKGRVWTGRQAKENSLVDELGGLEEAIRLAKREAGIPDDQDTLIRFISKPKGIQISPLGKGMELIKPFESLANLFQELDTDFVLALMPFWITVR